MWKKFFSKKTFNWTCAHTHWSVLERSHSNVFYVKKRCSGKRNLTRHKCTYNGEKPLKCKFCEKRFLRKEHLTGHERTLKGEKPFKCIFCGKRFSKKGHLTRHERTHTGQKPFKCIFCEKIFSRKRTFNWTKSKPCIIKISLQYLR